MKKKCTNGKCRKVFIVPNRKRVICPYCGKEYPRLIRSFNKHQMDMLAALDNRNQSQRYEIVISDYENGKIIQAIKIVHSLTGVSLREAKEAVQNISKKHVIISKDLSLLDALAGKDDINKNENNEHVCQVDIMEM